MNDDVTRHAVEAYFAAIGTADADGLAALFSPEAQLEDPVGGNVLHGQEGVRKFHRGLARAWQRLTMQPSGIYVRGNQAAAAWAAHGASQSGKAIEFAGVNTFEVDERGHIASLRGYWDLEAVVSQL